MNERTKEDVLKHLALLAIGALLAGCAAPYFPSETAEEYEARQAEIKEREAEGLMLQMSRPVVQQFDDHTNWVLHTDVKWDPREESDYLIVVPRGFVTDFASVPRIVWPFIAPADDIGRAGVVHDYLYWTGEPVCSRVQADKLMLVAMIEADVGSFRRSVVYRVLRWFGGPAWRNNANQRAAGEVRIVPEDQIHLPPRRLGEPGLSWKKLRKTLENESEPPPAPGLIRACREVDTILEDAER